jgi:hypothetical protein
LLVALKYSELDDRFVEDSSPMRQMKRRRSQKMKLASHDDILET